MKDTITVGIVASLSSAVTSPTRPRKVKRRSADLHLPRSSVIAQLRIWSQSTNMVAKLQYIVVAMMKVTSSHLS